jgi:hypothetical protein
LIYGSWPRHSRFHVNESGFHLILAEGYLLYALSTGNGRMYVYDTEEWVGWIRRLDVKIEEMFLYTDEQIPFPLVDPDEGAHLTGDTFLRKDPRP